MSVDWGLISTRITSGDVEGCRKTLASMPASETNCPEYLQLLAATYCQGGEFAAALELCLRINSEYPFHLNHRYLLVDCCTHLGLVEVGLLALRTLVNHQHYPPGIVRQILSEGWVPLGCDERVLALDTDQFVSEYDRYVSLCARATCLMRSHGIAHGVPSYLQHYCSRDAVGHLYPELPDVSQYWCGQRELPSQLTLKFRGGMGDSFQWRRYANALECLGVQIEFQDYPWANSLVRPVDGMGAAEAGVLAQAHFSVSPSLPSMWSDPFTLFAALFPFLGYAAHAKYLQVGVDKSVNTLAADIRSRAQGKPCVALFWSANESPAAFGCRSLTLPQIYPLLEMDAVHWVVLQRGYQAKLWRALHRSNDLRRYTTVPADFSFDQTLALLHKLDMLVSIDSGLIHAGGALGTPSYMLANAVPEWRWENKSGVSPWYPSVKIIRAPRTGAWNEAIASLVKLLQTH